ncbi:MAG: hypothetical protein WKF58_05570 [Ilumatobacteraceae bacterium]
MQDRVGRRSTGSTPPLLAVPKRLAAAGTVRDATAGARPRRSTSIW